MTYKFKPEELVRSVPTKCRYQKERACSVVRVNPTQVAVRPVDGMNDVMYRLDNGIPVRKIDQQFPCYAVRPQT